MSQKYLDLSGLSYFWTQLKAKFTDVNTKIDNLKQNVPVTTSGTGSALTATISGLTLSDGATIRIKLHTAIGDSATLNVNSAGAIPILTSSGANVTAGALANSYLTLIYNGTSFILQGEGGEAAQLERFGTKYGQISTYEFYMMGFNPDYSKR